MVKVGELRRWVDDSHAEIQSDWEGEAFVVLEIGEEIPGGDYEMWPNDCVILILGQRIHCTSDVIEDCSEVFNETGRHGGGGQEDAQQDQRG
jgi:hypothetical protein